MFKLLVVEDDKDLNSTVCSYLNQNGYEAVGCPGAEEAYDAMYGGTLFDMIISDIMMPGVDGIQYFKAQQAGKSDHLSGFRYL
jgi:DNA-binding response OmpR family regulator